MKTEFRRLVRFRTPDGKIVYGEASAATSLVGQTVPVYEGDTPWNLRASTDEKAEIIEVLCPLPSAPLIYGIGLNYKKHIEEANFPVPPHPTVFTKPADAVAGPFEDIPINEECKNMDYEGELCIIIGKDCKNLGPLEDPADYILGYAVGNDVSSRYWQNPERSGNQHGYAKSFDKFAPIGPILASTSVISDPSKLELKTRVNGEERQNTSTGDLLFTIPEIMRHLSRATTLRKGTVIMTGTPSGVAAFMKPPAWLRDGDVVEISISEIGTIKNKMVFEQ